MDAEILAARLQAAEASILSLDGRIDEILKRLEDCSTQQQQGNHWEELTARLAVLEAERQNLQEEARIAEAEAREAEAEALEATMEAAEAAAEAAEAEAEEEQEAPSLEVIEAPEETPEPSQTSQASKRHSDWENLGLNL